MQPRIALAKRSYSLIYNRSYFKMTVSHQPATRPLHHWTFLLLILLAIVVYYPGLSGDYMFDDTSNLLQNQALDMESLDMESLTDAAWSSGAGL